MTTKLIVKHANSTPQVHALALMRLVPVASGSQVTASDVNGGSLLVEVCPPGWMDLSALAPHDGR